MNGASKSLPRTHVLWLAFMLHRVSGIGLALFLPVHFWVLAMAYTDPSALGGLLNLTQIPIVKLAEAGLVFLLAVHMFGGLRLMALEWVPWTAGQKTLAATVTATSFFVAGVFFLQVI